MNIGDPIAGTEFSFRTRAQAIQRFQRETFDLLIVGGGITGAAVARDATTRGLKVALVERKDFAYGTSSRSSKLIHGGLRYLENLEFGLVFEALAERALLLKTVPNMVRPLPFYLPVYRGDLNGPSILSLGLWLYDILALFRAPGAHRRLSKTKILSEIPFLKAEGLKGGFQYFDASMWDDVLAVETVRAACEGGAAVANYVEAVRPLYEGTRITGFALRDQENPAQEIHLKAHRTVICAGPWTDQIGLTLSGNWQRWLKTSKGVHLVFDLKRIPIPGAMVMSHPDDGRISFVIPRPDYGAGVVIVGTTDGPTDVDPDRAAIEPQDVRYLMGLLTQYFPELKLTESDIVSAYVGVRPLMGSTPSSGLAGSEGQTNTQGSGQGPQGSSILQKVSREHHIDRGPGGTVIVAGGKYTTHRRMAEEIVDFTLKVWKQDLKKGEAGLSPLPQKLSRSKTRRPLNPLSTETAIQNCREEASRTGLSIPDELISRYGAEALSVIKIDEEKKETDRVQAPEGFSCLKSQLRHAIRREMVVHLEDFYLRRLPLYASRKDHGWPWAKVLVEVWADELGLSAAQAKLELLRLESEVSLRSSWTKLLG